MSNENHDGMQKKMAEARKWDVWYNQQLHKYHYECGTCESRKMTEEEIKKYGGKH